MGSTVTVCEFVCGALLVALGPALLRGQDPSASDEVQALERQRQLTRTALAAEAAGELDRAQAAWAAMLRVTPLVPPPFTSGDPRLLVLAKARALRVAVVERATATAAAADAKALGKPCPQCAATGVLACVVCKGSGLAEVRVGRQLKKEKCEPWEGCPRCRGSGRLGAEAEATRLLLRLSTVAASEAARKDPFTAVRNVLKDLKAPLPFTLAWPVTESERLRRAAPRIPFDADTLKAEAEARLKVAWSDASPLERRHFLAAHALDVSAFARALDHLDDGTDPPSLAQVEREAKPITLAELEAGAAEPFHAYTTTIVVGAAPVGAAAERALPLAGRLFVPDADPRLVEFTAYAPEDLEAFGALERSGFFPAADRLVRVYPPRAVVKVLKELGEGVSIVVTGRIVVPRRGVPACVFEVWRAERADSGGGRK